MAPQPLQKYCYRVDEADTIIWVDEGWLAFARENGASQLNTTSVLGRSLWDFVADRDTKALYEKIHARLRGNEAQAIVPFRCDSPSVRRYMQLTIESQPSGELHYESVVLRAEPVADAGWLDMSRPRADAFLTMCSCCKRGLIEPRGWLDVGEIATLVPTLRHGLAPHIRYTVCAQCAQFAKA